MFGSFLMIIEALTWVTVSGVLLAMLIPCPDFPFIVYQASWPVFLGCVATLVIRPILQAVKAFIVSLKNIVISSGKNLETPEDVAAQNIETPVDFCWYMASIQIVEMRRVFGDSTITLRTDGEFSPKTNTIFFQMFGRHPYQPDKSVPKQVRIGKPGGLVYFCDDTSECWAFAMLSEAAKITGKAMSHVTQDDVIRCMSKHFIETHNINISQTSGFGNK